jgi:hypothetical protein
MAVGRRYRADAGHAVLEAARLDHLLLLLLLTYKDLPHISNRRRKEIDTFGKRRRMALAHGLIDADTNHDLEAINDVRALFAHAERPLRFTSAPVRVKARRFNGWRRDASARRLFDEAVARSKAAIKARISALLYEHATTS